KSVRICTIGVSFAQRTCYSLLRIIFNIYLEQEITEEEKAKILRKINERFFSFKVAGEAVLL
ncbi:MAG: hypothetical protein COV69_04410, partial [Parcubacteria group bacterium CG11_big_fil_rev_8_21_14_0_20_39_14]